jgi:small conductance mechanosensitive channel
MLQHLYHSLDKYWISFIEALPRLGLATIIVVGGIFMAEWISALFRRRVANKAHDPLMEHFLSKAIKIAIIILVCFLGLRAAGLSGIAGAILATAGASAVVVGFAFKDIAENFIAGIILAFNRPFNVDETIQIDSTFGKVKDMAFRYTQIHTFDGRDVYIPNADVLKKPVINFTGNGFYRLEFVVGIAYENPISTAMNIIQECLDKEGDIVHDDEHINFVVEDELAASSVELKAFFWITTEDYRRKALITRGKIIRNVKEQFDAAGIYMPCNVQELKVYEPTKDLIMSMASSEKHKPEKGTKEKQVTDGAAKEPDSKE